MLRITVAVYLMVAQVAGSLVCCCTVARLAPPPIHPTAAATLPPAPAAPCCCHHKTSTRPQQDPPKRPDRTPPAGPGCPCQRDSAKDAATVDTGAVKPLLQQRHLEQGPAVVLPFTPPVCGAHPLTTGGPHALPFLSADDILHALHILRC